MFGEPGAAARESGDAIEPEGNGLERVVVVWVTADRVLAAYELVVYRVGTVAPAASVDSRD